MAEYTAQSVKISDIKIIGSKNKIEDIKPLAESIRKVGDISSLTRSGLYSVGRSETDQGLFRNWGLREFQLM
jgi:hypothetical protein